MKLRRYSVRVPTEIGSKPMDLLTFARQWEKLGVTEHEANKIMDLPAGAQFASRKGDLVVERIA